MEQQDRGAPKGWAPRGEHDYDDEVLKIKLVAKAQDVEKALRLQEQRLFPRNATYLVSRASKPSPVDGFHRAVDRGLPYRVSSWTMT